MNKANIVGGMLVAEPSNQITLPSGKKITLNDQQVAALEAMTIWLDTKDDFFYTLSGFAGTGKTTITLELIKIFREKNKWKRIAVSAPTHKAKKVIARATGEDSFTIQKLLGLRPNTDLENFNINNPQFDERAEKEISAFKLLIIDEASMLNESLFTLILKEAKNHRVKVLFMGDVCQLPPVKESISKIFTDIKTSAQLTHVERQKDSNPLMGVYDLIRSDISSAGDLFEHKTSVNEAGEGIVFCNTQEAMEAEVLPLFCSEEYKRDSDYIKLITYSNASVQAWNKRIRAAIFPEAECPFIEGDVLLAYSTVTVETDLLIENSADYKVKKVVQTTTNPDGIEVWKLTLRLVDENIKSEINIVRPEGLSRFLERHDKLLSIAKKLKGYSWRNYYEFKHKHLLCEDIRGAEGQLLVKKDIDYAYALTTHRSQGSTFTNVAVSENNLDTNKNHEERNKLKYVAFSRPTTKAIILSNKS